MPETQWPDIQDALTATSILLATILGAFTLWQNRRHSKRAHTIDILLSRFSGGDIAELIRSVSEWITGPKDSTDGKESIYEVQEILNLYEFISAAARKGTLDIDLIFMTRGGAMQRTFEFFHSYILYQRKVHGNEKLWEHFEWFVESEIKFRRHR